MPLLFIVCLVVGVGMFFGWLVGRMVEGYGFGLIGNMVVGVIGAAIGLLTAAGITGGGLLGQVILSSVGAVAFLLIIGLFRRRE